MSFTPTSADRSLPPEGIRAVATDTPTSATSSAVATPVTQFLSTQQAVLLQRIAESNTPGNLEGLFAFHVIGHEPAFPLI